ncbi:MAG TPA: redoxin domain-containing protein [Candidatus Binatia bacterium]|jgi:peroxiredoxin|nr:redoxin domain-containing protein [Candidatus Binatia bacterium]
MNRLLSALLVAFTLSAGARAAGFEPATLPLGSSAQPFSLMGTDGRTYALEDFAGAKILLVIFTCNHCPTAQYYEERIKQLAADYRPKSVAVVAIMPNDPKSVRLDELGWTDLSDSLDEMKIRDRDRQFNFPYLYDGETEAVAKAYGPVATPHAFIFDATRKLRYVGAIDDSERVQHVQKHYARDALDALLAGQEPPVTKTKVVGCSVKWAGKSDSVKAYLEKLAAEPVSVAPADADALKALRKNDSGKFRLVSFWATWCAPCVAEFHEFITINRMYRHRDFELVTVSINRPDEEKTALEFLKKNQASCRNLIFASADREKLIDAFAPEWQGEVPYTVLLSPEGKVIYRETGSIDPLAVKRALVGAMNERKPW